MIEVTEAFVAPYFQKGKRCHHYMKAVDIANHLQFHFDGYCPPYMPDNNYQTNYMMEHPENPYFKILIDSRRPSESETIKDYRRKIYLAYTKAPCFKVHSSLKKIVKSQDWNIDYSKTVTSRKIKEEETLERYCEFNYPFFGSVENWMYAYGLKYLLTDPNALVCVLPMSYEVAENEYKKPFSYIVPSKNVYDYQEGHYAVFLSEEKTKYTENGIEREGNVIMILTPTETWQARQTSFDKKFSLEIIDTHNIGMLPAFRLGGTYKEISHNTYLFDSFISPMLPGLDAAARESSDLDAEVVQHIYSTMWYFAGQECNSCNGTGKVLKEGKQIVCSSCEGMGRMKKSPYKDMVLKPGGFDEQSNIPVPPAGYIIKPTDIVKIQDERIQSHIFRALSAINMEFLASVPLSQSGIAKEVDRDELNNFVYQIAYQIVEVMNRIYFFIGEYRYAVIVPSAEERRLMLPKIAIPEKYDLLNDAILSAQLESAKRASSDETIINELEIDYVNKKFNNSPEIKKKIGLIKRLDPLPSKNDEQKANLFLSGAITLDDFVFSTYINHFIERAIDAEKDFLQMKTKDIQMILQKYLKEKIAQLSIKNKLTNVPAPGVTNE